MQYLLLIYEDEKRFEQGFDGEEFAEYGTFGEKHKGAIKGGNALQPTGTAQTVRVRKGETTVMDGPFAETKEQLGGYFLIEAADLDAALSWAARCPASGHGTVEVRPMWVM